MNNLKDQFLLDPEIAYLNHGSYGACPRPVFEAYQKYQRELETEPATLLYRNFSSRIQEVRESLSDFLHCGSDQIAFVRNVTYGMNMVALHTMIRLNFPKKENLTSGYLIFDCAAPSTIIRGALSPPIASNDM